ncbi:MAG: Outer rane efflux protein precursor [Gemmatimonadetes bacterium]|nr:Outer rane efflux protein precursor [Gemmatimonadota bacterium]
MRVPTLSWPGLLLLSAVPLAAQAHPAAPIRIAPLDSLVAHAVAVHPAVHAAVARLDAARARVAPAGTRPDPMLMAGIQNFPVSEPGFGDFMTMKMVGVSQSLPYPGKLALRRRAAEGEVRSAEAAVEVARQDVIRRVREPYYELAYLDRAMEITARTQQLLVRFAGLAEANYRVGMSSQQDVIRARLEASRLAEQGAMLAEQHRSEAARLNEALDRPTEAPLPPAVIPDAVVRAAVGADPRRIRFVSPTLGARAADSPLPPLESVQEMAVQSSPMLREHGAMLEAQAARVELARREHLPDFDVSLQYGQRNRLSDMVSATVSVPLPVHRAARQDAALAEARAESAALDAEHHEKHNEVRGEVARRYADLERERSQLALYVTAILPQSRASLEAATASYPAGKVDFLTLMENQAAVFNAELAYHRALADFAKSLAALDQVVGREVLP